MTFDKTKWNRNYYRAHAKEINARRSEQRQWLKENDPAKYKAICEKEKLYAAKNYANHLESCRKYRKANRDKINEKNRAARKANPEKFREYYRKYYQSKTRCLNRKCLESDICAEMEKFQRMDDGNE